MNGQEYPRTHKAAMWLLGLTADVAWILFLMFLAKQFAPQAHSTGFLLAGIAAFMAIRLERKIDGMKP